MFQLSLERENQISVIIKIWKKYWLYSLLISLSYPTHQFCLSWISAHFALDGLEESGWISISLSALIPWLMDFSLV